MGVVKRHGLTLFIWSLMFAFVPTGAKAQEGDKQKAGTTVDAWRQALPPDTEAQTSAEDPLEIAQPLPTSDETRKALLSLEHRLMESVKSGDADSLSQIISGDFTFASPRLIDVRDRTQFLEHALSNLKITSYEFAEPAVRLFGRTAIVTSRLRQKATMKGEDWGGNHLVTDVWISRGGTWRIVSRHESLLREEK